MVSCKLESEVAQYPRIVVGPNVISMLAVHRDQQETDHFAKLNKSIAKLCLDMLIRDIDGFHIIHYLGDTFQELVTQERHPELYKDAKMFATAQLLQHQNSINTKLAFRYGQLLNYLHAYSPSGKDTE